jgi:hypothetical protein
MTAQCAHCSEFGDLDAYRICDACRAKAATKTPAGRIWRAHLQRHDRRCEAGQGVMPFGELPEDWAGWVS